MKLLGLEATITRQGNRIFINFPFNRMLLDEVKNMSGAKWHGFEDPPRKVWSVADNERNQVTLDFLQGKDPYAHYSNPIKPVTSKRPLRAHQLELKAHAMQHRFVLWAAEMGTGKTLTAIDVMEDSGHTDWWWVGPKSALLSVHAEFAKWKLAFPPKCFTYERLVRLIENWPPGLAAPRGVVFDESSRLKNPTSQRSKAAAHLCAAIRREHKDGRVILMSGSPAPKSPVDWWSQCEILAPGFLKEGDITKFKKRLARIEMRESLAGGSYPHLVGWWDDERKCGTCCRTDEHDGLFSAHPYTKSVNEVEKLYKRMRGLVKVVFKKDCLDLPDKVYKVIHLPPSRTTKQIAAAIVAKSKSGIQASTLLRELSDGFQYIDSVAGWEECAVCKGAGIIQAKYDPDHPDEPITNEAINSGRLKERQTECPGCTGSGSKPLMVRDVKQVATPKEAALKDLLDGQDSRIVIYAGFQASVDRAVGICNSVGWKTIRVDGRGWAGPLSTPKDNYALFQSDSPDKVAFVGHPDAAGMGLTLTKASVIVYYSNSFSGEARIQSEDRIHRIGMDTNKGATIIDLFHLPTDELVLDNLKKKRRLQDITLGMLKEKLNEEVPNPLGDES